MSEEARAKALEGGVSPLEFMLAVLRDEKAAFDARMDAAKAAAPYVHAKLASIEHKGEVGHFVADVPRVQETADEWASTNPSLQ